MQTSPIHQIKSIRIAKARMGSANFARNFKAMNDLKDITTPEIEETSKIIPPINSNRVLRSAKTQTRDIKIEQPTPSDLSFIIKLSKADENPTNSKNPGQNSPNVEAFEIPKPINRKRIKTSKVSGFLEDGKPWTEEEMQKFESQYSEIVFDNTIDIGSNRQANLDVLKDRSFKSYRNVNILQSKFRKLENVKAVIDLGERMAFQAHSIQFSQAQLMNLLVLCQNEKIFFEILKKEKDLLINYLEKAKLNPRRKFF